MAQETSITFDKTEIVILLAKPSAQVINLTANKIVNIQFDRTEVKKLLSSKPTERITLTVSGREKPIELLELDLKEHFASYKESLIKFAKDNRISLRNKLTEA